MARRLEMPSQTLIYWLVAIGREIAWHDRGEVPDVVVAALRHPGQRLMVFPVGEQHAALLRELNAGASIEVSNMGGSGGEMAPTGAESALGSP